MDSSLNITFLLPDGLFVAVPATLLIICIVLGNSLVIVAVTVDRKLKNMIQNWFIVSLAMADCLVGLLIMPMSLVYELLGVWIFGTIMCDLWLALDVLFVTASILNLCLISLDRYWSIADAINYLNKRTPKRAAAMIATVWVMALLISFPPLVGWRAKPVANQCNLSTDPGYVCYSAFGSFFIPVSVLIFVYGKIFHISRRRNRARRDAARKSCDAIMHARNPRVDGERLSVATTSLLDHRHSSSDIAGLGHFSSQDPMPAGKHNQVGQKGMNSSASKKVSVMSSVSHLLHLNEVRRRESDHCKLGGGEDYFMLRKRKILRQKDRRATFILGAVLFSFILCWMPFFVVYILGPANITVEPTTFDIIFWLGYCNSALNPIIYTILNKEFRLAFKKILTCTIHR